MAGLLLAVLMGTLANGAGAQDEAPPDSPALVPEFEAPTAPPPGIEAIEITGERLDATDVQDDAQAITAFSGADLDKANIVNIDSLQFSVPGLHVGQSGQQAIVTLRGVGTENASITGEPGVAFHVDGVNYSQPSAARVAFFDLEALDIKRGPQGLQGGKNSTSGSINVITRKPSDEYEVSGDFLMGNYDRQRARGAVNIPVGELFALRTAVFYEDRDGFLDNVYLGDSYDAFDADDFGFRSHVLFKPSDTLEGLLTYNYFKQGGVGPQSDIVPNVRTWECGVTSALPEPLACPTPGTRAATEDADPRSNYLNFSSSQNNLFYGLTGTLDWEVPGLPLLGETHLKGIGGFQSSQLDFDQDFDATDRRVNELYSELGAKQHTAELQWSGTAAGERLDWQASGYYARETGKRDLLVPNLLNLVPGVFDEDPFPLKLNQNTENYAFGAALHTRMHVGENVRIELGGRWIKDRKASNLFRWSQATNDGNEYFIGCEGSLGLTSGGSAGNIPVVPPPWCRETFRGKSWGTGLDWRPFGDDHLLYAKLDRGYKSGGFRSGGRGTYLPEKIWAYALGTKSEFFDSRVQLNLEGFFYNYTDMQLVIIDGTTLRTENADTRMYGWDVEARANPIEGLDLGAVVSFLKTEVLDYFSIDPADLYFYRGGDPGRAIPEQIAAYNTKRLNVRDSAENLTQDGKPRSYATSPQCYRTPDLRGGPRFLCGTIPNTVGGLDDYSGNELSRAPKWKITLSGGYDIPIGRFGTLTPRVQYTWQDETYFRVFNRDFDLQEAYHLTDVKLEWRSPEERWDAEIFIQNIEDEAPIQNILVGPRGFGSPPFAWYGPPRFYGVRVGFKY